MNIMLRHFRYDCKENKKYNLIIFKKLFIFIILNKKKLTKNNKMNLNKY